MVIADGEVSKAALRYLELDEKWLDSVIKAKGTSVENVFIMTAENGSTYTIIEREKN